MSLDYLASNRVHEIDWVLPLIILYLYDFNIVEVTSAAASVDLLPKGQSSGPASAKRYLTAIPVVFLED